jgi:hypothetical protein
MLRRRVLVVDESPTLTRMFTFVEHVESLLLRHFLKLPAKINQARLREENMKRLSSALNFMAGDDAPQFLRRTALVLSIPAHVSNVCGQLKDTGDPLIVKLAKGTVLDIVSGDLARLIGSLHLDAELDVGACLSAAIAASMDLVVRFQEHTRFGW